MEVLVFFLTFNMKLLGKIQKSFWGYSDITALHTAVSRYAKLITFHGPMIEELGKGIDSLSLSSLISYSIRIQPFYLHQNVSYLALTVQLQVR